MRSNESAGSISELRRELDMRFEEIDDLDGLPEDHPDKSFNYKDFYDEHSLEPDDDSIDWDDEIFDEEDDLDDE